MDSAERRLLDQLLDSWDRNNTIHLGMLRALAPGDLDLRAMPGSPTIARMFMHIHYVRLVFVQEDAPESAVDVPAEEWQSERDPSRIAAMLNESAIVVADAVRKKLEQQREMDLHYDHPILLLQHMLWHEGYHHGQMKLALKLADRAMSNDVAGPLSWRVWMNKTGRA